MATPPPSLDVPAAGRLHARGLAAVLAGAYFVLCCAYIVASSALAARLSQSSVERMALVETAKGLAFVLLTSLAFYLFALRLLRRVQERQEALARSQDALMSAERRALAGVFASSIAHDMNNILTLVGAGVGELADPATPRRDQTVVRDQLEKAVLDLSALAQRLVAIGRSGGGHAYAESDLSALAAQAVDLARTHATVRHCQITVAGEPGIRLRLDPCMISQLLINLLLNAAEATGGRGRIEVVVKRHDGEAACLEVHDNGAGIPDAARAHLFEPFATTKAHGTGLGLVSVRTVAERHGGSVAVERSPLGGALFRVILRGGPR